MEYPELYDLILDKIKSNGTHSITGSVLQEVCLDLLDFANTHGGGGGGGQVTVHEVTYSELVTLRNSGELVPGDAYQITDYVCTTLQGETQAANHQFDIVVPAISETELSEEGCWAVLHTGDTYFADCDLSKWKIWYCLDNDNTRFSWVDPDYGKGVIYRMIDEWGNDCPYDFKNIMFARYRVDYVDATDYVGLENKVVGTDGWAVRDNPVHPELGDDDGGGGPKSGDRDGLTPMYFYTFSAYDVSEAVGYGRFDVLPVNTYPIYDASVIAHYQYDVLTGTGISNFGYNVISNNVMDYDPDDNLVELLTGHIFLCPFYPGEPYDPDNPGGDQEESMEALNASPKTKGVRAAQPTVDFIGGFKYNNIGATEGCMNLTILGGYNTVSSGSGVSNTIIVGIHNSLCYGSVCTIAGDNNTIKDESLYSAFMGAYNTIESISNTFFSYMNNCTLGRTYMVYFSCQLDHCDFNDLRYAEVGMNSGGGTRSDSTLYYAKTITPLVGTVNTYLYLYFPYSGWGDNVSPDYYYVQVASMTSQGSLKIWIPADDAVDISGGGGGFEPVA